MLPSVYRAPSFSWAAVDSPVTWLHLQSIAFVTEPAAEVLEKNLKLSKSAEKYGAISDCELRLKAPVLRDHLIGHSDFRGSAKMTILGTDATLDAIDDTYLRLIQLDIVPVYVIGLVRHSAVWYCLVAASDDGVHFRRLGYVSQDWTLQRPQDPGWHWQEVSLM